MTKNKLITIGLGVGLVASIALLTINYNQFNKLVMSGKVNVPKDIASVKVATASQPSGYGVRRPLTGELKSDSKKSMGDINFDGLENETFEILGKLSADKDVIHSLIKKEDKNYTSTINWTNPKDLTIDDYKALMVVCGQITEDELNKEQAGRYTVVVDIPPSDKMDELGAKILFDVDDEGYLTLWTDVTTKDSRDSTEIEELKSYTLYYEGNIIKIK